MVPLVAAAGPVTLLLMTSCAPAGPAVPPASATPGPAAAKATEPCASGGLAVSPLQTAPPTTAPTATTPAPTTAPPATPATPPSPTPTLRPAPPTDRVGFPEDYQTKFRFGYAYDRRDAKSVSYICFNDVAAAVKQGQPFPRGSAVVFESWRPREDAPVNLRHDANDNSFSSTTLKPGETFSTTLTKAGIYMYFCSLHPDQMRARVEVKD